MNEYKMSCIKDMIRLLHLHSTYNKAFWSVVGYTLISIQIKRSFSKFVGPLHKIFNLHNDFLNK